MTEIKFSSMIKIDGNEILIKRTGSVNSSMTYKVDTKKEFVSFALRHSADGD